MPSSARARAVDLIQRVSADRRLLIVGWLVIAAEAAFAVYQFRPWAIGDSAHYLLLAQNLADGRYGTITAAGFEPDALRPPGYPVILWLLLHVLGMPRIAVVVLQLLAYCASLFAIQKLMFARAGSALFILVCALYPFPLLYSTYLLAESWTIAATTAAALLLVRRSAWRYVLAGISAGVAAIIRADLLLLPLVLAGVIFIRDAVAGETWWRAAKVALLPPVAAAFVLLPYAVWNDVNFGRFTPIPVAGAVGTSLYLSTWQDELSWDDIHALEQGRITQHMEDIGLAPAVRKLNHDIGAPANILAFDPHAYPTVRLRIAAAQAFRQAALERISANPGSYVRHVVHNVWGLWVTKHYEGMPELVSAGLMVSCFAVFLLGFAGMAVSTFRPRGAPLPWLLVPLTLYPAAIHLWLHTEARYTAATRPLLMMFAAGFLIWVAQTLAPRADQQFRKREARTA